MTPVRRAQMAAVALLSALTLTACTDVALTVDDGGQVTGLAVITMQQDMAALLGISSDEAVQDVVAGLAGPLQGVIQDAECTTSATPDLITLSCPIEAGDGDRSGVWSTVVNPDGGVTFTLDSPGNPAVDPEAASVPGFDAGTVDLTITMPGPVLETTGDAVTAVEGRAAQVALPLATPMQVTVTSGPATGVSPGFVGFLVIGGAAIVLASIAAMGIAARSRGAGEENAEAAAEETDPPVENPAP